MEKEEEYALVMPFKDQSPEFAHGFECGQLWQQMTDRKIIEGEQINAENREQVEMICKRFLYEYKIGVSVNGWCSFDATPTHGGN